MRRRFISTCKIVLGTSFIACTNSPNIEPQPAVGPAVGHQPELPHGIPRGTPTAPAVTSGKDLPYTGPWEFIYTPGTYIYTITTATQVKSMLDTNSKRTLQTTSKKVVVRVTQNGETQIASSLAPTPDSSTICDTAATIAIQKHQLVPNLPRTLVANSTWNDSTSMTGCLGPVSSQANVTEKYAVLGDTIYDGITVLHVQRLESITANGEGRIGQHRLLLTARGNGIADLYFDLAAGRFLGSARTQIMKLDITASGQTSHFTQYATQHATLLINP